MAFRRGNQKFQLGYKIDIGAVVDINTKHVVRVEDFVPIGSHCSIYSVSTIDDKTGPVKAESNQEAKYEGKREDNRFNRQNG